MNTNSTYFKDTELVLNQDGSVYHLNLLPNMLSDKILLVGDQGRVSSISKHFDKIEHKVQNREFLTHTGIYKGKRITALSSGIGTDNIDIVMNELDALVNIDLSKRISKESLSQLNIVRIGTCGALQADIAPDTAVVSEYAIGLDGLLNFYDFDKQNNNELSNSFVEHMNLSKTLAYPYSAKASEMLFEKISAGFVSGITVTSPGFYAPQGRELRANSTFKNFDSKFSSFNYKGRKLVNFEMETSAIYGLSKLLGHEALTVCLVVGNRITKQFSNNYKPAMDELILKVLDRI